VNFQGGWHYGLLHFLILKHETLHTSNLK
jgi:hypothetical protein